MEDKVLIEAPIDYVFAYVADFRNTSKWHKNMKKVGWKKDTPPGLGSEYYWTETFAGMKMVLDGVITSWDPPNAFAWKPTGSPYPITGGWTFIRKGNATETIRYSDNQLGGVYRFFSLLMIPMARKQVKAELQELKRLVETSLQP